MKSLRQTLPALIGATLFVSLPAHGQGRPSDPAFKSMASSPQSGNGRWTGSLGFGMTISRGNSNSTQASLSADAVRALRDSRIVLHGLFIRNTSNGDTTADNDLASARYERNFAQAWFGFGDATLERDPFKDLELRQTYGAGAGYRLLRAEGLQLNVYGGLAYTFEDNKTASDAKGIEPMVGNDFTYALSQTATLSQRWVLFPNTVGRGGIRSVFQVDLSTKITERFGLQLSVLNKFREKVLPGEKKSDTIIFTGITANF
ncbi:YdiY family protein [Uliginosibacterium sp. sgz301328]|uniref:DUF481 domain-containing protein n=1 Tax=Uliginosibacterium sp. sgz301328 TaxID=3243764 RepID=UPI00359D2E59